MHIFIYKNLTENLKNHFKIFDVKKKFIYITIFMVAIIFLLSLFSPIPYNYLDSLAIGYKLKSLDNLYDYFIPFFSSLIIIYIFFNDYNTNTYKILAFLNRRNFNYLIFYRWILYVSILCISTFLTGLIHYRSVSFLDIPNITFSIRFLPHTLFLTSLVLLSACITKNIYASILVLSTYYCIDFFSSGYVFKIFSIGFNSNNIYYTSSPEYYLFNRVLLTFTSFIFVYISCKISSKI